MMKSTLKWTAAIAFSLLAHGGAATLFEVQPEKDQAEIAGGEAMEVTLLGNAFEEALQAGDPNEALDPIEEPPEQVEPILPETADVVPEEITPVQPELAAEAQSDVPPVEADVILPSEEMPPVVVATAEVTATVPPVETVIPEEKPELEPKKAEKPKPERQKKPEPKQQSEPKKKAEPKKEKPVKKRLVVKKAGDAGANVASQSKGQADGSKSALASVSSGKTGARSSQAGNAAVSNYSGKIRSKLSRAFRYPSAARRDGLRGTAQVRFTVSESGSVSGVSIAKSAGSSILDQAAIETVHRASPFPPIPEAAGKSAWTFTIPLAFAR